MPCVRATLLSAMLSASFATPCLAATGPEPEIEGPRRPEPASSPAESGEEPTPSGEQDPAVPAPNLAPKLIPTDAPPEPGIEFAVPPPETEEPEPIREEPVSMFPDPGMAPSDGVNMLVLGSTTAALTIGGVTAGLVIGLQNEVELSWLLPSTIVPGVGLLAFSAGGLYLGITRARAYRRWEIGYRVIGQPQGGGLMIGGSFTLLGALGLIPTGVVMLPSQQQLGAALIGVGSAAAVATPIMFVLGVRNSRRYQATGGWKRKPIPPLPPGAITGRLELRPPLRPMIMPTFVPMPGRGFGVGAVGRF